MKHIISIAAAALLSGPALAQDTYFGLGLSVTQGTSNAPASPDYDMAVTDFGLALTAGYRFATVGTLTYGLEGNLDIQGGKRMSDGPAEACSGVTPSWCEIDTIARLRATVSSDLSSGNRWTASLGAAIVSGLAEDNPGVYVDTVGRGLSLGVAWEKTAGLPVRVDVNYDAIRKDDANNYTRDLDILGLRLSYMF